MVLMFRHVVELSDNLLKVMTLHCLKPKPVRVVLMVEI